MYLGDIGQSTREEIDIVEKGGNYQWAYREGSTTTEHSKPMPSPLLGTDKPPLYDYGRGNFDTCVIGGYVYRGSQMPELIGKYIFGDNTSGRIWSLTENGSNSAPTVTYLCNIPPGNDYTGLWHRSAWMRAEKFTRCKWVRAAKSGSSRALARPRCSPRRCSRRPAHLRTRPTSRHRSR